MSKTTEALDTPTPAATAAPSRDDIRSAIFGAKPRSEVIQFFGMEIELRQPVLGIILEYRRSEQEFDAAQMMLLNYTYVPGTDDKVFEDADLGAINSIPFGEDMTRLTSTVAELMGQGVGGLQTQIKDAVKSA